MLQLNNSAFMNLRHCTRGWKLQQNLTLAKSNPRGLQLLVYPFQRSISYGENTLDDETWAAKVASKINSNVQLKNKTLLECYPGRGILSKKLFERGLKKLVLYEPRKLYIDHLKNEKLLNENELTQHERIPINTSWINESVEIHSQSPQCSPQVIVGYYSPSITQYLISLCQDLANQEPNQEPDQEPNDTGQVTTFFLGNKKELELMESNQLFFFGALRSALYKILFDFKTISKVPVSAFSRASHRGNNIKVSDGQFLYLISLTPKENLFENICERQHMNSLISLLKLLSRKRSERIITMFEELCPGVGRSLLLQGFRMTSTVSGVTPQQLATMFQVLLDHPNFEVTWMQEKDISTKLTSVMP